MSASEQAFLRSTVGLLAHQLKELAAYVGAVNALIVALDEPEISDEAKSLNPGFEELHTSIAAIADTFPPPQPNGGDGGAAE